MRLTPIETGVDGGEIVLTAASADTDGDSFINDGRTLLYIVNGTGGPVTVTVDRIAPAIGEVLADVEIVVGAGKTFIAGPFRKRYFNDATGQVFWTYSSETDVDVAAVRVGR